jgi:hypothetical protein
MTIKEDLDTLEKTIDALAHEGQDCTDDSAALGRMRAFVESSVKARLSRSLADWDAFQRAHGVVAPLRSGEAPEILTPAEQEAESWEAIEAWLYVPGDFPVDYRQLTVEKNDAGVFVAFFESRTIVYSGQPCTTRADALAQAAQWCLTEGAAS